MTSHALFDTRVTYPDDGNPPYIYSTFSHLATRSVIAAIDDLSGNAQTLTLGASSNVVLEAANNIQAIVKDTGKFEFYNHVGTNHVLFLSIHHNDSTGEVTFSTQGKPLFLDSPVVHMNDLQVNGYFNIEGGIIGNSLNVVKYNDNADAFCVGYGFRINPKDELELIKYAVYENDTTHAQSSILKKVAIFGTGNSFSSNEASDTNNALLPFNTVNGTNLSHLLTGGITTNIACSNIVNCSNVPTPTYWTYSSTNNYLYTNPVNAYVGINTNSPTTNLHVNGSAFINNISACNVVLSTMTFSSDFRLKENIIPFDTLEINDCLEKINKLRLVRYNYKNNVSLSRIGFIAQQVESITSDIVTTQEAFGLSDCKTLDISIILAYLVGAIQSIYSKVQ
jgi:hypothetical protein